MNTLRIPQGVLVLALLFVSTLIYSQSTVAYQGEVASIEAEAEKTASPSPYRFHKKLPVLYEGYAIEIATSTYPLNRTNSMFRKFGNVHYDKLEQGGYSYVILGRFSDDISALRFLHNIIVPKAEDARLVHYKDGIRKIVRAK